jgi:bleomycin hydrolase
MNPYKTSLRVALAGTIFGAIAISVATSARADDGSLTRSTIRQFRESLDLKGESRALYNAITAGDMAELAINRDILRRHNTVFSHKVETKGVTHQKRSGRCWLFAGLNLMRPAVIERHNLEEFEFSQNYLAFYDKLEKANRFLEFMIEKADCDLMDREMEILLQYPYSEGGWWNYVVELVEKYGVVPQPIMPETSSSENSKVMLTVLRKKLKSDAMILRKMRLNREPMKKIREAKTKMLAEVYRMLVMNLGEPPTEFEWRWVDKDGKVGKRQKFTPHKFYKKEVGVDLQQYVSLYNDPTQPYGKHYRLKRTRNLYDGEDMHYANCKIDILKQTAMKQLIDGEGVWFAVDMGRDQNKKLGIMADGLYDYDSVYGTKITRMTKAERMLWREGVSNHAMALMGVDVRDGKPVKWLVENSWGKEQGDEGLWTLYDDWFDEHVYEVIVKKDYVSKKVLDVFKQEPKVLPPWYPTANRLRQSE